MRAPAPGVLMDPRIGVHAAVQVLWAAQDPAMPIGTYGERARAAAGLAAVDSVPGKHFPQEDQAPAIAARVAAIALAREKNAPN